MLKQSLCVMVRVNTFVTFFWKVAKLEKIKVISRPLKKYCEVLFWTMFFQLKISFFTRNEHRLLYGQNYINLFFFFTFLVSHFSLPVSQVLKK